MNKVREVVQLIDGLRVSDGDGVQLTRLIGTPYLDMLDPFLMLDAFGSDKPQDYIGGFPAHPHRGFETVTYMLAGKMRHQDNKGNEGVIEAGDIQWMTAGKGIIHSEMPEQENGLLAGFQLWINLPAAHKMTTPSYQEMKSSDIPVEHFANGDSIKVIAGITANGTKGVIVNEFVNPTYWDVRLSAHNTIDQAITAEHNAFVYVIDGGIMVGDSSKKVIAGQLAVLSHGEHIKLTAEKDSRLLLVGGKPLNETVARGGPFVMNTREEINQAFRDYQTGRF